jgi:hypothetical protein
LPRLAPAGVVQADEQVGERGSRTRQVGSKLFETAVDAEQPAGLTGGVGGEAEIPSRGQFARTQPVAQALFEDAQLGGVDGALAEAGDDLLGPGEVARLEHGAGLGDAERRERLPEAVAGADRRAELLGREQVRPGGGRIFAL